MIDINNITDEQLSAYLEGNSSGIESILVNGALKEDKELQEVLEVYKDIVDCCELLGINELKDLKQEGDLHEQIK